MRSEASESDPLVAVHAMTPCTLINVLWRLNGSLRSTPPLVDMIRSYPKTYESLRKANREVSALSDHAQTYAVLMA